MTHKPFPFQRLPKTSLKSSQLLKALQTYLPRIGFSAQLGKNIRALVSKELGGKFSFQQEKITSLNTAQAMIPLQPTSLYVVIGMSPLTEKAVLEVDLLLAHRAIDKLLGGKGEPVTSLRPLTEIETGVISYLFLKILEMIFQRCGASAKVHFRLEAVKSSLENVDVLLKDKDMVQMNFKAQLDQGSGPLRLFLPSPFVQGCFLDTLDAHHKDHEYEEARLSNFGYVSTSLWAELGRTTLLVREINQLESGDVVVLENTEARMTGRKLEGCLPLRIGSGNQGSFRGRVVSGDPVKLRLESASLDYTVGEMK